MNNEEALKQMAVEMCMAVLPDEGAWDKLMDLSPGYDMPEEFEAWEPFESWPVEALQVLAEDSLCTLQSAYFLGRKSY